MNFYLLISSLGTLIPVLSVTSSITVAKADAPTKLAPVVVVKSLSTIQAKDSRSLSRVETQPQFEAIGISDDGKTLFLKVQQLESEGATSSMLTCSLQAIDLSTGQVSIIYKLNGVGNFTWHPQASSNQEENVISRIAIDAVNKDAKFPKLRLQTSIKRLPTSDKIEIAIPQLFDGKVIYNAKIIVKEPEPHWESFLIVRELNHDVPVSDTVTLFPIMSKVEVDFPEFSPDGKEVLLKVGQFGDRYDQHYLYLWQTQSGKLRIGPKEPTSYLLSRWSPDSRFIAYMTGVDIAGEPTGNQPGRVHIYDLRTNSSRTVAQNINGADFAWSNKNHIFYSKRAAKNSLPDIYEISTEGGTPKLIIKAGYAPKPSPDNKCIAFLGWPNPPGAPKAAQLGKPGLYIFNLDKCTRTLVKADVSKASFLWTPDSKRLVVIETQYDTSNSLGEAKVNLVSLSEKATP